MHFKQDFTCLERNFYAELIYRALSICCLVYLGITLLLMSTWMTWHHSFPLEECVSNPNKREHVEVMGYFNLSREAMGWTGLGCFTESLHQANTAYPQKNYLSCTYITMLYWQCAIFILNLFCPSWIVGDQRSKNVEAMVRLCHSQGDSIRAHKQIFGVLHLK